MGNSMTVDNLQVNARLSASITKDLHDYTDIANPTANPVIDLSGSLTDGRDSGNANLVYYDSKQLAIGASQDYDLVGTLVSAFGDTINFDRVKCIVVNNTGTSGTHGDIRVIGQTFSTWCKAATDYVTVKPGGSFMLFAPDATGFDISAGADTLRITNTSGTYPATYKIGVAGVEIDSSSSSSDSSSSTSGSSSSQSPSSSSESSSSST
jgi:hypothetical protein